MRKSDQKFVFSFMVIGLMVTIFGPSCYGQTAGCPSVGSIFPCTCSQYQGFYAGDENGIKIDCQRKNLTDSQMSTILNTLLVSSGISPVVSILASSNQLTKVPDQIAQFPKLTIVYLGDNQITEIPCGDGKPFIKNRFARGRIDIYLRDNQITRIPSGAFDFPSSSRVGIDLTNNKITSVASDSFRFPSATFVAVYLDQNRISAIPDGVFNYPSVLQIYIGMSSNNIDVIPPNAFNFRLAKTVYISLGANYRIASIPVDAFNFPSAADSVYVSLTNTKISEIPCGSFNYPSLLKVGIDFSFNSIKKIPSCAFIFPSALDVFIHLRYNAITTISPGAFNFPSASKVVLFLNNNQISSFPPHTFAQGNYQNLYLRENKLTRFDSAVFKSPLNGMVVGSYPPLDITGNPIDCSTDPCHLLWLLKGTNSSKLLNRISGNGVCSGNGDSSPFSALKSFPFASSCPCFAT